MAVSAKKAKKRREDKILNKVAYWLEWRNQVRARPWEEYKLSGIDQRLRELSDQYYELTGHRIPTD